MEVLTLLGPHPCLGALQRLNSIAKLSLQSLTHALELADLGVDCLVAVTPLLVQVAFLFFCVLLKGLLLRVQISDGNTDLLIGPLLFLHDVALVCQTLLAAIFFFFSKAALRSLHGRVELDPRLLHLLLGHLAFALKLGLGLVHLALCRIDTFVDRRLGACKPLPHGFRDFAEDALLHQCVDLEVGIFQFRQDTAASIGVFVFNGQLDKLAVYLELEQVAPRQLKVELEIGFRHDLGLDEDGRLEIEENDTSANLEALPLLSDLKVDEGFLSPRTVGTLPAPDGKGAKLEAVDLALELHALTPDASVNLDLVPEYEGLALDCEARRVFLGSDDAPERAGVDVDVLEANHLVLGLFNIEVGGRVDQVDHLARLKTCRLELDESLLRIGTDVESYGIFVRVVDNESSLETDTRRCSRSKELLVDDLDFQGQARSFGSTNC